jgi:hypothetical protein
MADRTRLLSDKFGAGTQESPELLRLFPLNGSSKGPKTMNAIMDFLGQTWVMVGMGVALVALIGVMIFLRMKPRDEE